MKYTQVPVGFRMELFAAEPDVINPIYMAWDERGRLWVVETVDYPNEFKDGRKGNDRIKICEDTDGDGKADKFTVFAEGFNIPTSMTFARGGVILAHAPEFISSRTRTATTRQTSAKCCSPAGVWATRTPARATCATGSTTGSTAQSATPASTAHSAANSTTSAWECFASSRTPPTSSFCTSSTTTHGLGFNAAGDVFGSPPTTTRRFSAAFRRRCSAVNAR